MTTPNPTDGSQQVGAAGVPTPEASQPVAQGNSRGTEEMPAWAQAFEKRLANAEKLSQSKQSEADRKIAAANKQSKKSYLEEIEPFVQQAARIGQWTPEQTEAFRQNMAQAEVNRRVLGGSDDPVAEPASQGSGTVEAAQIGEGKILQMFGVSPGDEGVMDALRAANGDEFKLHSLLLARRESIANKITPTPASNAASINGVPPGNPSQAQLRADYEKDIRGAAGQGYAAGDAIKNKYRALGLAVDEIAL